MSKRKVLIRWVLYLAGMAILAVGLTLNTKTGLGVSAILSVAFAVSEIWTLNFGNIALVLYALFVVAQMLIHGISPKTRGGRTLGAALLMDALQFPLSLGFTRVMNLVSAWVPVLREAYEGQFLGSFVGRVLILVLAVALTGIGAAITLNMRIVPNPADGMVQTLAELTGKSVGFTKNWFDLLNVCINLTLGFVFAGGIVGVGLGTVVAALGTGRVVALVNRVCGVQMKRAAGV
jgi:uncharacterized membrane protein YczE